MKKKLKNRLMEFLLPTALCGCATSHNPKDVFPISYSFDRGYISALEDVAYKKKNPNCNIDSLITASKNNFLLFYNKQSNKHK